MTSELFIDHFRERYLPFSNFSSHPVRFEGDTYPTVEHAFHAAKTDRPNRRVFTTGTPRQAKLAGRAVTGLNVKWWDSTRRHEVMAALLHDKFTDPTLRALLVSTGDALLVENTTGWCDQDWGDCGCPKHRPWPGHNYLGRALMRERDALRAVAPDWFPRVAVTGHRPQHITAADQLWVRQELTHVATHLRRNCGMRVAISGMAVGSDTWWAQTALIFGTELWAYIPSEQQTSRWPQTDIEEWTRLRSVAARELVLAETYGLRTLHARNEYMIRDCNLLIAVHDPRKTGGGTASAITKARNQGTPLWRMNIETHESALFTP